MMILVLTISSTSITFADKKTSLKSEQTPTEQSIEAPIYDSLEDAKKAQTESGTVSADTQNIQSRAFAVCKLWFFVIRDGSKTDCVVHVGWDSGTAIDGVRYTGLVVENASSGKNYGKWMPKSGNKYRAHALVKTKKGSKSLWNVKIPKSLNKVNVKVNSPMVREGSSGDWFSLPQIREVIYLN